MNELYAQPKTGVDGFIDELSRMRQMPFARIPSHAQVMEHVEGLLTRSEIAQAFAAVWRDREFWSLLERPLLLMAALRFDALTVGVQHPLWAALAKPVPEAGVISSERVAAALEPGAELWRSLRERSVQTNETSRAIAWLMPAQTIGRPLALVDAGASAGLNLVADRLPNDWTDPTGRPLAVGRDFEVAARLGLDKNPIDVAEEEDRRWLLACLRPGETERAARLEAAIDAFQESDAGPTLLACDAAEMAAPIEAFARRHAKSFLLVYQTGFRDYLPSSVRKVYEAGMQDLLLRREPGTALWVQLETEEDGGSARWPVAITAHFKDAAGRLARKLLARCDYNARVLLRA